MTRRLICFHPVPHPIDAAVQKAFRAAPKELFPDARQQGDGALRVLLTSAAGLHRPVDLHLGETWQMASGAWRPITWVPVSSQGDLVPMERFLPTFVGELGLLPEDGSIVLDGAYDPPLGLAGEIVDAVAMGHVAQTTGRLLVAAVAEQVLRVARRAPRPVA